MAHRSTETESSIASNSEEIDSVNKSSNPLVRQQNVVKRSPSVEGESESESVKWHNLPKDIWKQAAEVND